MKKLTKTQLKIRRKVKQEILKHTPKDGLLQRIQKAINDFLLLIDRTKVNIARSK